MAETHPTDSPQLRAWLDQEDARLKETIRRCGQSVEYVLGCGPEWPCFAYTVGLFGLSHPELLIFGLGARGSTHVLNQLGELVREDYDLVPGEEIEVTDSSHRLMVEAVPNPGEIVFAANRYYARPAECSVPVLQLTYDDGQGRFPWDAAYRLPAWLQPRPGTFSAK
jgi:hypothetical protein